MTTYFLKKARRLRKQGLSYNRIAEQCGKSVSTIYASLNRGYRARSQEKKRLWRQSEEGRQASESYNQKRRERRSHQKAVREQYAGEAKRVREAQRLVDGPDPKYWGPSIPPRPQTRVQIPEGIAIRKVAPGVSGRTKEGWRKIRRERRIT